MYQRVAHKREKEQYLQAWNMAERGLSLILSLFYEVADKLGRVLVCLKPLGILQHPYVKLKFHVIVVDSFLVLDVTQIIKLTVKETSLILQCCKDSSSPRLCKRKQDQV